MEQASYFLFWAGFISVIAASVTYVWYAVGVRVSGVRALTNAGVVTVRTEETPPLAVGRLATVLTWFAVAFLGAALVTRAVAAGRPPYGNLWEYFMALGFGVTLFYGLFEWRYRQRTVGAFVLPVVAVLFTISELFFPSKLEPLVPALQNNRLLAVHVACMLLSYSVLAVAFGAAVLYLLQGEGRRFPRLPSGEVADEIGHKAILVGFPLLGLGIALGAYWGNYAWGRYWGWDPKETTALVSWLIYAGYMHARALGGWRGRRTAVLSIVGFASILFNLFVVNFVVSGLHTYAGV
ncbi:MAG TPA: c-type cytochrome biogenesis protein CcsB [Dehalococcoidia bacterium]